jgi:GNAT superfamily N-acetyltransferase
LRNKVTKPQAAIRRAKAGDLEEMLRLVEAYYKFDSIAFDERGTAAALRRLLREESLGRAWVIDAGHALAGYAILSFNYDLEFGGVEGILTDMFVAARYRRKRFGAKMMAAVRDFCAAAGINTMELQVTRSNWRARLFYKALGFNESDRIVLSLEIDKGGSASLLFKQPKTSRPGR